MADRSSRPHTSPAKTSPELVRQIVRLRWRHRLGPVQIAGRLGIQASTVHAVLVRCRINRLSRIDRVAGEPLRRYEPRTGTAFVHTVIDDHSRAAYAEICADAKATTAIGVLLRAVAWFTDRGVTIERVLSDNGSAYKSYAWRDACTELGITHKRTRPYRPQTNGKIERFHRTLATDPTPPSEANPPSPD